MRREKVLVPVMTGVLPRWGRGHRMEVDRSNRNHAIASLP